MSIVSHASLFAPPPPRADGRVDLAGLTRAELAAEVARLGEPAFRAAQLWRWIHRRGATDFAEMTDLGKALRARLAEGMGPLCVRAVPNRHVTGLAAVAARLDTAPDTVPQDAAALGAEIAAMATDAVTPAELADLAAAHGVDCHPLWRDGDAGRFDAVFLPRRAADARGKAMVPVSPAVPVAPGTPAAAARPLANTPRGADGDAARIDAWRAFLRERLPEHMVPAVFVPLDALPMTPNGKVDVHRLPLPDTVERPVDDRFVPPRDAVDEVLAAIWREVLGVARVGIHDNFFDLGGHSLLATRAVTRLREELGVDLSLNDFFRTSTIAEIHDVVVAWLAEHASPDLLDALGADDGPPPAGAGGDPCTAAGA